MIRALLDLVLPTRCAGCEAPGGLLCPDCHTLLRQAPRPAGSAWTMAAYRGPVRSMIVRYKDRGASALAAPLGSALATVVAEGVLTAGTGHPLLLVPVPSARRAVRRRAADTTLGLARLAAAELRAEGLNVRAGGFLRRMPGTPDQVGLRAAQRRVNLLGGLRVTGSVEGLRVVVVDDVTTTGASVAAARHVLGEAGAEVVGAATIAAARLDTDKP